MENELFASHEAKIDVFLKKFQKERPWRAIWRREKKLGAISSFVIALFIKFYSNMYIIFPT